MSLTKHDGGKGDTPRPMPNREQFEKNFDLIFGKKEKKSEEKSNDGNAKS
jgi:hypothetical protein